MTEQSWDDYEPTPEELNRAARKLKRKAENENPFIRAMFGKPKATSMAMKPKPKPPMKPGKGKKC